MCITPAMALRLDAVDTFGQPADMTQFDSHELQRLIFQAAAIIEQGGDTEIAQAVFDAINIEFGRRGL